MNLTLNNIRAVTYSLVLLLTLGAVVACGPRAVPNYLKNREALLQRVVTEEEIGKLKKSFDQNPEQYSKEYGEMILFRLIGKNHTFGRQLAELPDLNDGISPRDAEVLKVIDEYTDDVKFPADFASVKKLNKPTRSIKDIMNYHVLITWTTENEDYNKGSIAIIDQSGKIKIKEVKPVGFEPGDKIESVSPFRASTRYAVINAASALDPNDKDGIEIKFSADRTHYITVAIGGTYNIQKKLPNFYNKAAILEEMTLDGLKHDKRRYSPSLEAFYWLIFDGKFDADKFPEIYRSSFDSVSGGLHFNYPGANDSLYFTLRVWGDMKGPRWKKFKKVTLRLNLPELVDYYTRTVFVYKRYLGYGGGAGGAFETKGGNCVDIEDFQRYCLNKGGFKARFLKVEPKVSWGSWHAITQFYMNGKMYIMDNGVPVPQGILGPFKSLSKIPYTLK